MLMQALSNNDTYNMLLMMCIYCAIIFILYPFPVSRSISNLREFLDVKLTSLPRLSDFQI
jgi:hypothetical protein